MASACNAGKAAQRQIEMQCQVLKDAVKVYSRDTSRYSIQEGSVCARLSIATVHVTGESGQTEIRGGSIVPWVLKRGASVEWPRQTCSAHPGRLR